MDDTLYLPGLGQDIATRHKDSFRIFHWVGEPITRRECKMLDLVEQITNKPDWPRKVGDEQIKNKWKAEAINDTVDGLSENCFEYCIAELHEKAKWLEKIGMIPIMDRECAVMKSDVAVPQSLRDSLRECVLPLESVPEKQKDWHPRSNDIVLDLVHPSLFPLVYGTTRALREDRVGMSNCLAHVGEGEIVPRPQIPDDVKHMSADFQWLPSNIHFTPEGNARITSYINNLHPYKHADVYPILEQLLTACIPLWNRILSWKTHARILYDQESGRDAYDYPKGYDRPLESDEESDDDTNERWELDHEWREATRVLILPEPDDFSAKSSNLDLSIPCPVNLQTQYLDTGIQVIIKLANIHLTPEKPAYDGGSWHVEGLQNEQICATALYYYDCTNITDSYLAFEQECNAESLMLAAHEQHNFQNAEEIFGVETNDECLQEIGRVLTREGRLLAFPNTYHHQVQPFKLADPTLPGHRKIVAFFLVDPHNRITSTANVPPQQADWWREIWDGKGMFGDLPVELRDMVAGNIDYPMSMEKAKEYRLKLMDERGARNKEYFQKVQSVSYCEH